MSESSFQDIKNWLNQLPGASKTLTTPSILPSPPSTSGYHHKRRASMASTQHSCPSKRHRIADDRTITPTRDVLNQLRLANPPVICGPLSSSPMPESARTLRKLLTDGFGHNIIPRGLESRIRAFDSISAEDIPGTAYFDSNTMSDAALDKIWHDLKRIYVVVPILNSSIQGWELLQLISVQSQQIDPSLIPRFKNAIGKIKADYALSFTCRDPSVQDFYDQISLGGHGYQISQTKDAFTKRVLLFSGVEVRSDDGGKKEALAQLAIWLSAGLEKTQQMREQVKGEGDDLADWALPNIGLIVIGHDWYAYLAYKVGSEVHVAGPISAIISDTRTIYGILKVRDLIKRVAEYATQIYWPWIRDEILHTLASQA
ncbi:hypothetical protein BJX63DRAFT_444876 [Aspergillus granulosus]|uniref:PD-(D/E)XK nuclease-like domain-containing protein n=1 Tax=Aspergillus granulosus TaxID=176169 RepID=A0ABR4H3S9_9EURO